MIHLIDLAERGMLPDWLIRRGMRRLSSVGGCFYWTSREQ